MVARSESKKTGLVRLAYDKGLREAVDKPNGGGKHFTGTLLIPKTDEAGLAALSALVMDAAEQEWPGKAKQMLADKLIKSPFLDGDGPQGKHKETGKPHEGFPGHWFIRPTSGVDYPPQLYNRKVLPATTSEVYSGVWGYAVVQAYAWTNPQGGKGVSFNISMFQAAKDDKRLGNAPPEADKFLQAIPDEGEAPAETKSGAGAAGLFG